MSIPDLHWSDKYCFLHALKNSHMRYSCVVNNVYWLKIWICSRTENLTKVPIRSLQFNITMNTLEILKYLSEFPSHTSGVFPADQIPREWTKPTAFVRKTDDYTKPTHHFDSYGLIPIIPDHMNRLRKNCKLFRRNNTQLQINCRLIVRYLQNSCFHVSLTLGSVNRNVM